MAHPDHETRIGAHDIFSIVLMPSIKCPMMEQKTISSDTVSWLPFSSPTQKLTSGGFSFKDDDNHVSESINGVRMEESQAAHLVSENYTTHPSRHESSSFNHSSNESKTV